MRVQGGRPTPAPHAVAAFGNEAARCRQGSCGEYAGVIEVRCEATTGRCGGAESLRPATRRAKRRRQSRRSRRPCIQLAPARRRMRTVWARPRTATRALPDEDGCGRRGGATLSRLPAAPRRTCRTVEPEVAVEHRGERERPERERGHGTVSASSRLPRCLSSINTPVPRTDG